jgi:hypothetical protein
MKQWLETTEFPIPENFTIVQFPIEQPYFFRQQHKFVSVWIFFLIQMQVKLTQRSELSQSSFRLFMGLPLALASMEIWDPAKAAQAQGFRQLGCIKCRQAFGPEEFVSMDGRKFCKMCSACRKTHREVSLLCICLRITMASLMAE